MNVNLHEVTIKRVLTPKDERDIVVKLVPFDRRNDEHVDFALAFSDMLGGMPSTFKNITDVSIRAVELFMAHTEEDTKNEDSDYSCVHADKRAARLLFNDSFIQKGLNDFFELA